VLVVYEHGPTCHSVHARSKRNRFESPRGSRCYNVAWSLVLRLVRVAMARQRHLRNAPITEAIIDFRTKLKDGFDAADLASLQEAVRDKYPGMDEMKQVEGGFKFEGAKVEQLVQGPWLRGYVLRSGDGRDVAQIRRDGFSFHRLSPYTDWSSVVAEAQRLWQSYLRRAPVELVTRVAVRYINRIDIPLPITDLGQYLTEPPRLPEAFPQELCSFLIRYVVRDREINASANVTQVLQVSDQLDRATIILDIDVYRVQEAGLDLGEIPAMLEQFRNLKNRIFFSSITEETAGWFE